MIDGPAAAIAPLEPADVGDALDVHARAFGYPYPAEALRRDVGAADAAVLGARSGGELLGFGVVRLLAGEAHVMTLAVAPPARGRGIGRALVAALRAAAIALGARTLTLEVREHNAAAIRLYRAAGLREVGRRRRYYRDTGEDALLMTAEL